MTEEGQTLDSRAVARLEQKLHARIEELEGVLRRIEEAKTPFSLDPLEHAHLCIETLREWAHDALDVKEPEHD